MTAGVKTTVVTVLTPAKMYHVPFSVPAVLCMHFILKVPLGFCDISLTELQRGSNGGTGDSGKLTLQET